MGQALAANAQRAGHSISLLVRPGKQRDTEISSALMGKHPSVAHTPADLIDMVDIVVICVTGTPQVEETIFSEHGLLSRSVTGRTIIDCSTSMPDSSIKIAAALRAAGGEFIDAAMTGTPRDAEAGQINLLLGGQPETLAKLEPLMRCWAKNLYHCGDTGAGHSVKLLHQFMVLSNAAIVAEGFSMARKNGINLNVLGDVIASGGANSTAFQRLRHYVEDGNDEMFRFSLTNALKDMRYYTAMGDATNCNDALGKAVLANYLYANELGLGSKFVPHLLDAADELNGMPPSNKP